MDPKELFEMFPGFNDFREIEEYKVSKSSPVRNMKLKKATGKSLGVTPKDVVCAVMRLTVAVLESVVNEDVTAKIAWSEERSRDEFVMATRGSRRRTKSLTGASLYDLEMSIADGRGIEPIIGMVIEQTQAIRNGALKALFEIVSDGRADVEVVDLWNMRPGGSTTDVEDAIKEIIKEKLDDAEGEDKAMGFDIWSSGDKGPIEA